MCGIDGEPLGGRRQREYSDGGDDVDVGLEPQARRSGTAPEWGPERDSSGLRGQDLDLNMGPTVTEREGEAELAKGSASEAVGNLHGGEIFA